MNITYLYFSFHFIYFVSGNMAHRVNAQREQSDRQTDRRLTQEYKQ